MEFNIKNFRLVQKEQTAPIFDKGGFEIRFICDWMLHANLIAPLP